MDAIDQAKDKMGKTISVLNRDLGSLRAGRANPSSLDRIMVDYYGSPTPIVQMGNITVPEPRILAITPYDSTMLNNISKAIQKSDLGINPTNDGRIIRLVFPELTEERRKDLVKVVRKKCEDAKVAVRSIRRDGVEAIKKDKKSGELTEDDQKKMEAEMQKLTDKNIQEIDKIQVAKEKEILEV